VDVALFFHLLGAFVFVAGGRRRGRRPCDSAPVSSPERDRAPAWSSPRRRPARWPRRRRGPRLRPVASRSQRPQSRRALPGRGAGAVRGRAGPRRRWRKEAATGAPTRRAADRVGSRGEPGAVRPAWRSPIGCGELPSRAHDRDHHRPDGLATSGIALTHWPDASSAFPRARVREGTESLQKTIGPARVVRDARSALVLPETCPDGFGAPGRGHLVEATLFQEVLPFSNALHCSCSRARETLQRASGEYESL
jgi:hypothetical protein